MSVDGSLWYVKLADGDVERVTLDELDEAFQSGKIDENSMVLAGGSEKWIKLSELLGEGPPPDAPAPRGTHAPAPIAAAQQPARAPVAQAVPVPPVQQQPRALPASVPQMMAHPVAIRSAPVQPVTPLTPSVSSLRPSSFDISLEEPQFRSSSKKRWAVVGLLGVFVVAGAAFVVVRQTAASAASDPPPPTFAAAPEPPREAPPPEPAASPTPAEPAGAQAGGPSSVMDPTRRLTDDQRQQLLQVDKKGPKKKAKAGGGAVYHAPSKDHSTGFTTGGNKYDPLNSSL